MELAADPPAAQVFACQGVAGEVPCADIEDVYDRHDRDLAEPADGQLKHELRVPLETEVARIMREQLQARPMKMSNEEVLIPSVESLQAYTPPETFTPTTDACFLEARTASPASSLPVNAYHRDQIAALIATQQITILSAPSGSGRSSQTALIALDQPQFHAPTPKRVLHVNASPLACVNTALSIASTLGTSVGGDVVGYVLPLEAHVTQTTQLVCTTPEMVLRMMMTNKDLGDVGCVVLDDFHLLAPELEVMFAVLKTLLFRNDAMRLVVVVDAAHQALAQHLHTKVSEVHQNTSVWQVPPLEPAQPQQWIREALAYVGRGEDEAALASVTGPQNWRVCEWKAKTLSLLMDLIAARQQRQGGVLQGKVVVFLPSWGHMQVTAEEIARRNLGVPVLPLHDNIDPECGDKQAILRAVHRPGPGIILATKASGISIAGVEMVLDSGYIVELAYNYKCGLKCGDLVPISTEERARRAMFAATSAVSNPDVFHLYLAEGATGASATPVSKTDLRSVVLLVKALPSKMDVSALLGSLVEAPEPAQTEQAIDGLKQAALLSRDGGITQLGMLCATLPVPFHVTKMLFYGVAMRCLDAVLTIAAGALAPAVFTSSSEAYDSKVMFSNKTESDPIAVLHAFIALEGMNLSAQPEQEAAFCEKRHMNHVAIKAIRRIRGVLLDMLQEVQLFTGAEWQAANQHMKNQVMIKSCVGAGYYPNVLLHRGCGTDVHLSFGKKEHETETITDVLIHPYSAILSRTCPAATYAVYADAFYTTDTESGERTAAVHGVSVVDPFSLVLYSGAGAMTMAPKVGKTGQCRGWYGPEPSLAWSRATNARFFIEESLKAKQPGMSDNPAPFVVAPAEYDDTVRVEVALDNRVKLVAGKPIAELCVKMRQAVTAVTQQRILAIQDGSGKTMAALFDDQIVDMLKLSLTRITNPHQIEQKLRADYLATTGPYRCLLEPVFRTYTPGPPMHGGPGGFPPGPPGMGMPFPLHPNHGGWPPGPPGGHGAWGPGGWPSGPPGGPPGYPPQPPPVPPAVSAPPLIPDALIMSPSYQGQQPSAVEKSVIDALAKGVFDAGSRDAEIKMRLKHAANPTFAFLQPGNPLGVYYEWKLYQLAKAADKPPLPQLGQGMAVQNPQERARAEARRQYLEDQGMLRQRGGVPGGAVAPGMDMGHEASVRFVGRSEMRVAGPGQPPPVGQTHQRTELAMLFNPGDDTPHGFPAPPTPPPHPRGMPFPPPPAPGMPPGMPPPFPGPAPPYGMPRPPPGPPPGLPPSQALVEPRRVEEEEKPPRRPLTPRKVPEDYDPPQPLDPEEVAKMSEEDLLKFEADRLRAELRLHTLLQGDVTEVGEPPAELIPEKPQPELGAASAASGSSRAGAGRGLPPSVGPQTMHIGKILRGMNVSTEKGQEPPVKTVKRPSVLVGPIPSKADTKGCNLPLILAKALGEALGTRCGPTVIVGQDARIDVPSYSLEERAIKKQFFVCLGKKILIKENDRIFVPEDSVLATRLDSLRRRVKRGRGDSEDFDDNPRGGRRRRGGVRHRRDDDLPPDSPPATPVKPAAPAPAEEAKAEETKPAEVKEEKKKPAPKKGGPPPTYKCPKCKAVGEHWVKDCPLLKK
eukprot:TRINITY_DN19670_c0_g1_i1.p1 TRINITY_DN19670_c0_g1~~TRINITY_DN19670_c0_g1_i1.p1  ORF type:complete len:1610 (+),score=372.71 TRINITY_DN19670_c0_g1_i1:45-4874(+)